MQYVNPSVFMTTARKVIVFHDYDSGGNPRFYLFQVASHHYDSGYASFDVRELAARIGMETPVAKLHLEVRTMNIINAAEAALDLPLDTLIDNLGIMVEGEG